MAILPFIIVQVVAFVMVVFALRKMMMASSLHEVQRLQKLNVENAKKARELEEKIEAAETQYREKIDKAEDEIRKMKDKAREEADRIKEQLITQAKEERDRIISQALNTKEKLREEIEGELLEKSLEFSRRIIADAFGPESRKPVYDGFMEEVLADLEKTGSEAFQDIHAKSAPLVRTSHPMSPAQKERLERILSSKTGGGVSVKEQIDKEVILGIIIQMGSFVIDGSLISKFKKAAEDIKHGS
jgi:F-type H+-transporting ATPase subunit b